MAVPPKFTPVNHDDEVINRVQDQVSKAVDPLTASPLAGATLAKKVVLKAGLNVVPHGLDRMPLGWAVVRQHAAVVPVDWTAVTLLGAWVAFGGGFNSPQYRLKADGVVELRGAVKTGTTATNIGSVPAALAPAALVGVPVPGNGGGGEGYSRLNVNTNGTFGLAVLAGGAGPATYVGLDNVRWDIAPPPAVIVSDVSDSQTEDATRVIRLTSSAAATVDLLFF